MRVRDLLIDYLLTGQTGFLQVTPDQPRAGFEQHRRAAPVFGCGVTRTGLELHIGGQDQARIQLTIETSGFRETLRVLLQLQQVLFPCVPWRRPETGAHEKKVTFPQLPTPKPTRMSASVT